MNEISIIIPVFNEAENIESLMKEIQQVLEKKINYEIIIVNDCSVDNTLKLLSKINIVNIKVINHNKNLGQSKSILTGIKNSNYDTIVTIDGDSQNNPKDIIKLHDIYFSQNIYSLVGGLRIKRKDSIIKILSSKIANSIRQFFLDDNCKDTGCSLKIFNKKIFLSLPYFDGIHRFLPALYKGYGHKTFFIDVDHRARIKGQSKYGTIDRLIKGVYDLFRVKKILKDIKKND
tara:strand:+ start:630 stop:1325 length:696 start_codon:yes stop_codon:yes gene_type:complete